MKKIIVALCAIAMATAVVSCGKNEQKEKPYNPTKDGIVGEWVSEGENISVLFQTYFPTWTKLYVNFEKDGTYVVKTWDDGAIVESTGVYTTAKSGFGNIWTITCNQATPSAITSEGIFEIYGDADNGYTMKYEVIQTEPSLGTAPTAEGGFGSSSGGMLGTVNVQTYVRQ